MLLRLTQQDDLASTTWINGTHHGVDPGVFHPESVVPSTKSGHAESTVKALSHIQYAVDIEGKGRGRIHTVVYRCGGNPSENRSPV